jgi:ferric-dicitrate binding protein FerR (iron transport regulator)
MAPRPTDQDREREAREALERVRRDTETVGTSSMARMSKRVGDHFAAREAEDDPVELWGRRIGRALSLVGVVVLTIWLAVQLGWLR